MAHAMNNHGEKSDTRIATRARLVEIFNRLLLEGDAPRPKVAEIIAEAEISRSTFYDYFDGVEALLHESLAGLLGQIARSLVERDEDLDLTWYMDHIWQNRQLAREMLTGARGEQAEAMLARQFELRLPDHPGRKLQSILAAGTFMAGLRNWIQGRVAGSPEQLAKRLENTIAALLRAEDQRHDKSGIRTGIR